MKRILAILAMCVLAGLTAADAGGLLFSSSVLLRDTRTDVIEVQVPALPTAACAVGTVTGEVFHELTFHAIGNSFLSVNTNAFGLGIFLDDGAGGSFEEIVRTDVGALNFTTSYFPPGTVLTFVFIYPVTITNVRSDSAVVDLLQSGSRIQNAVGGGGGSYGGGGNWGLRSRAVISARFDFEVRD